MANALVSIALCTYNGEKYLIEQLDSILNQTYTSLEIIVVDDLSKDNTLAILNSYQLKDQRIKIIRNESNLGYVKNFEKALGLCTGDYIALADQDDIWSLNKIELQLQHINNAQLIYHDSEFIDQNGKPIQKKMSDLLNMYEGESPKPFIFYNCVSGHQCLFKRSLLSYCLPFPDKMYHDRWLAFTAAANGGIKYLNEPLVKYRQHEQANTNILNLPREKKPIPITLKNQILISIKELEVFANYKFLGKFEDIKALNHLYPNRITNYLCFKLAFYMMANYRSLLFVIKKKNKSKFNFMFKHVWGLKLKESQISFPNIFKHFKKQIYQIPKTN